MQHSINFPSIESKLLLRIKVLCASYFKLVVKDTTPLPGFEILNFSFFSVYTTLLVPKQPISIKNFVPLGALQTRRAISDLFSFFYIPCSLTTFKYIKLVQNSIWDVMLHVMLFGYSINLNILTKNSYKNSIKEVIL